MEKSRTPIAFNVAGLFSQSKNRRPNGKSMTRHNMKKAKRVVVAIFENFALLVHLKDPTTSVFYCDRFIDNVTSDE